MFNVSKYPRIVFFLILIFSFLAISGIASANTAGLVIVHANGTVKTRAVEFDEPTISGTELIRRSGLDYSIVNGSAGEAVYMIDGEGDPNSWVTKDNKTYYWGFYVFDRDKWSYSSVGAGSTIVKPGDIQGWHWQFYGQPIGFPATSIPEMGFKMPADKSLNIEGKAIVVSSATVKKKAQTKTPVWAYSIFGLILAALAVILVIRLRSGNNRRK
jgi:hypothetical protein